MCMSIQCRNLRLSYVPEQQFRQFGRACMQPCRLCRRPRSHKTISIVVLHLTGPCIYVVVLEMFLVNYKISTCKFSSNSRLVTIERMHGMPVGCLYRWHAGEVWTQLAQGDKLCVAKDRLNCQLESLFERIETEFRLRPTMENIFKMDRPGSSLPKGAGYFSTRAFSSQLADIDSQAL